MHIIIQLTKVCLAIFPIQEQQLDLQTLLSSNLFFSFCSHNPPTKMVQRTAVTEFLQCSPALALQSHLLQWRFTRLSTRHLNPHKGPRGNSVTLMLRNCHLKKKKRKKRKGLWQQMSHKRKKQGEKTLSLLKLLI